jgi:hypothetical protein
LRYLVSKDKIFKKSTRPLIFSKVFKYFFPKIRNQCSAERDPIYDEEKLKNLTVKKNKFIFSKSKIFILVLP